MRHLHYPAGILACALFLLFGAAAQAQTHPQPQDLPYEQDFSSLAHDAETYPVGWQGWYLGGGIQAEYVIGEPAGDAPLRPSSDASSNAGGVHNYDGKVGLLGSGNGTSGNGALALTINTIGAESVDVSYDAMWIRGQARSTAIALQYRVGDSGDFTTLNDTEYIAPEDGNVTIGTEPQDVETITVTLPSEAANQALVQLRWVMRDVTTAGSRTSLAIDNISITAEMGEPGMTIAEARAAGVGAFVTVEGIVSRGQGAFTYFQDATAGLSIRQTHGDFYAALADGSISTGTRIRVSGTISEFQGLLQINEGDLESFLILEQDVEIVPQIITLEDLQGDSHQGQLVQVDGLTTTATGSWNSASNYTVTDASGTAILRVPNAIDNTIAGNAIPSGTFTFVGAVGHFNPDPQLMAINWSDVIPDDGPPMIAFDRTQTSAQEGGSVTFDVSIINHAGAPVSVDVVLTSGDPDEFVPSYSTQTLTFVDVGTQSLTLDLDHDEVYTGNRDVTFTLENASGGAEIALPDVLTLTILEIDSDATPEGLLAYWNFNTSTSGGDSGGLGTLDTYDADLGGFPADLGTGLITTDFVINTIPGPTSANDGDLGSFGGSTINALQNDESGGALAVRGDHNNGKHIQFEFSTEGYESVRLTFAGRGSSSGFGREETPNTVSYSTNGGTSFTDLTTYASIQTQYQLYTFNFGDALDDLDEAIIRFTFDGATFEEGNNRIDNVQILAYDLGTGPTDNAVIAFAEEGGTTMEGESFQIPLVVTEYQGAPFTANVTLSNGTPGWFSPAYETQQVEIDGNGTYHVDVDLALDGILTGDRLATFAVSISSGAAEIGDPSTYLLRIKDADEDEPPAEEDVIAYWNFNASTSGSGGGLGTLDSYDPELGGFPSDLGSGLLTTSFPINTVPGSPEANDGDLGTFGGTTINILNEDPSGGAMALRGQANNGEYVQYEFSAVGFEEVHVSFSGRGTSSGFGPEDDPNVVSYSVDGGETFTELTTYTSRQGTFLLYEFDLGDAVQDVEHAIVRFTLNGATSDSGNNRMDNFRIVGSRKVSAENEHTDQAVFALESVWPNPINGGNAQVAFSLETAGEAVVELFDVIGRRVSTVAAGEFSVGRHVLPIQTSGLSAGMYLVRLTADGRTDVQRITIAR